MPPSPSSPDASREEKNSSTSSSGSRPTLGRSEGGRPPPPPSPSPTSSQSSPSPPATRTDNDDGDADDNDGDAKRRGRAPFESAVLNTYVLRGTEHATWRRWLLEAGLLLGLAMALLGPAVGLAVMTPYISVTAGLTSDLRPGGDCLKVAPEACPVPLQFDYYFWNITNPTEWLSGERPVLQEVGPYAFRVRELRWNAAFSADKATVTFDRLYYNEAFLPDESCPTCSSLDSEGGIVTVNRGYLSVLSSLGGTEMPFVLGGVPAALSAVVASFEQSIAAGYHAQTGETMDDATAMILARRQWASCDLWAPDVAAALEFCAWRAASTVAGDGATAASPPPSIVPAPSDPINVLEEPVSEVILGALMGNPALADAQGSDPGARGVALFLGLTPATTISKALGLPVDLSEALQGYVRHVAASLVGPAFESSLLGPRLERSSGGLVVRRTAREWIEGWKDPLLSLVLGGSGPASQVSAAFAWPSRDAPSRALGGKPVSQLRGGDHPMINRVTITTGEPLEERNEGVDGRIAYREQLPTILREVDGSEWAIPPRSSPSTIGVRVGGSVDGRIFHQKLRSRGGVGKVGGGENLTLFDSTFGRPVVAELVPAPSAVPEAVAREMPWGTRFPEAGSADAVVVGARGSRARDAIPALRYSLSPRSAAACGGGSGGVERCAAPDLFDWAWNLEELYRCPTQVTLPHFLFADGSVLLENGTVFGGDAAIADPLQGSLTDLAGPHLRPNASLHSWWFAAEPFTGISVAARKPYQLSFGVGPRAPDVTAPRLWLPTASSPSSNSSSPPNAPAVGWVPTHWVATSFVLDGKPATDLAEGLRIVRMMRIVLSNVFPGVGLWLTTSCAWQLVGTRRARETRRAMRVVGASRAAKPELSRDELDEFAATLDADAAEGGGASGGEES